MSDQILEFFLRHRLVTTDTRKIQAGSIFFALKGERFNGNAFAAQALEAGAGMVVVDEDTGLKDHRLVRVQDALTALQQVAKLYRERFSIPFLAITGSNGKTTTKELVRDVLRKKYRVSATVGNLNNHIGIPLTILAIPEDCEFAVIEMGANHQQEIAGYCQYAKPDFALITNMGKAHLEGFGGEEGVVKGKRELYDYVQSQGGKIFVNTELEKLKRSSEGMNILPYGFQSGDFHLSIVEESPAISFSYEADGQMEKVNTHLAGAYNLYNIASAIAVGRYFGVQRKDILNAIAEYDPDNNRSQIKKTERNLLIMDAYNANPSSLEFALVALSRQSDPDKFFIIGDMLELGEHGPAEHRNILDKAKSLGLRGITVGPIFKTISEDYGYPSFINNTEALEWLKQHPQENKCILIKGSRGIRLEELVAGL